MDCATDLAGRNSLRLAEVNRLILGLNYGLIERLSTLLVTRLINARSSAGLAAHLSNVNLNGTEVTRNSDLGVIRSLSVYLCGLATNA